MPKRNLLFLFVLPSLVIYSCQRNAVREVSKAADVESAPKYPVKFVDVTTESGINFKHFWGDDDLNNILETTGSGAAFADYDNDGNLDLYVVNCCSLKGESSGATTNVLYRNNGDGTFRDVTREAGVGDTSYGMGCVFGDYDNDGDLDLYVTNYGPNRLYRNNGNGTFTDVSEAAEVANKLWSVGAAFADYDDDGDLDLYVANYLDYSPTSKVTRSRLSYKEGYRYFPGPRDYNGQPDVLYRNNGNGTFTDVTKEAGVYNPSGKGMAVVFGDYDNDGDVDLYVANDRTRNFLYKNNGKGVFSEIAVRAGVAFGEDGEETGAMAADFGDFDNDGRLDLIVTNMIFEYNLLYRNVGDDTFQDVTSAAKIAEPAYRYVGWGVDFFDCDNDGYLDIFVANGHVQDYIGMLSESITYPQKNLLFLNKGDGTFEDTSSKVGRDFSAAMVSRGACFGDYDNDGDTDIFITNSNDRAVLLRNDGGSKNNWLTIKTVGPKSNKSGVGARATVVVGDHSQIDEVRCGGSYMGQNDMRLRFGLGSATKADLVEIRWPSGLKERFRDVAANQFLIATEGQGIKGVESEKK